MSVMRGTLGLSLDKGLVTTGGGHQIVVSAQLLDDPVLDERNLIRVADGRQAMRDEEDDAAGAPLRQVAQHALFGLRIKRESSARFRSDWRVSG